MRIIRNNLFEKEIADKIKAIFKDKIKTLSFKMPKK